MTNKYDYEDDDETMSDTTELAIGIILLIIVCGALSFLIFNCS